MSKACDKFCERYGEPNPDCAKHGLVPVLRAEVARLATALDTAMKVVRRFQLHDEEEVPFNAVERDEEDTFPIRLTVDDIKALRALDGPPQTDAGATKDCGHGAVMHTRDGCIEPGCGCVGSCPPTPCVEAKENKS